MPIRRRFVDAPTTALFLCRRVRSTPGDFQTARCPLPYIKEGLRHGGSGPDETVIHVLWMNGPGGLSGTMVRSLRTVTLNTFDKAPEW